MLFIRVQKELSSRGLDIKGLKADLVSRLEVAVKNTGFQTGAPSSPPSAKSIQSTVKLSPGRAEDEQDGDGSGSADELDLAEMLLCGRLAPSTPGAMLTVISQKDSTSEPPAPVKGKRQLPDSGTPSASRGAKLSVPRRVLPGTTGLGPVTNAAEAALEKHQASEGRNVEHVALGDDLTEALTQRSTKNGSKRRR